MYDSSGQENSEVRGSSEPENSVGELKKGAEASCIIEYGYGCEESWCELSLSHGDESTSFKFSIDPDSI